jgi:hypothetical protein
MSTTKKDCDKSSVLVKLDKVADTLETASNQLSGAVSQQQLDLVRDRVAQCEADLTTIRAGMEILISRSAAHATEADTSSFSLNESLTSLERDFAGLRALVITSFALGTISLMGLIIFAVL